MRAFLTPAAARGFTEIIKYVKLGTTTYFRKKSPLSPSKPIHSYSESYRTVGGIVEIDIDDIAKKVYMFGADSECRISVNSSDLFHLAALFTRAFGRATNLMEFQQ